MLLTLRGPEYLPVLDTQIDDARFGEFVSIVGEVLRCGDHAVLAPPLLLERFSEWPGLSRFQRTAIEQAKGQAVIQALPFDAVTDSLVLTGPAGRTEDPESPTRWHRRDWTWLVSQRRLGATVLGGENLRDATWYRWLGRAWVARMRRDSLDADHELALRCRGFGGDTIRQELPNTAGSGEPVLCIVDSDRDHPDAPIGQTAQAASAVIDELGGAGAPARVEPLRARDVENILPLPLVEAAATRQRNPDRRARVHALAQRGFFGRPQVDPALAYVDLGKDQCEAKLLHADDEATRRYRERALRRMREHDRSCPTMQACELAATERCLAPKLSGGIPSSCTVVFGVKWLLADVLSVLDSEASRPASERLHRSTAAWLEAMLPDEDPVLFEPARLAWSWGLRARPLHPAI
ncbi:MAG: hypothetical protein AB1Z98_24485 [Nannocystaceae bacterium]